VHVSTPYPLYAVLFAKHVQCFPTRAPRPAHPRLLLCWSLLTKAGYQLFCRSSFSSPEYTSPSRTSGHHRTLLLLPILLALTIVCINKPYNVSLDRLIRCSQFWPTYPLFFIALAAMSYESLGSWNFNSSCALCHEDIGEWRCSSTTILDLGTGWKRVVRFTPLSLYPRENRPRYPSERRLVGSRAGLNSVEKRKSCHFGNRTF
jgi:hypothetical protein